MFYTTIGIGTPQHNMDLVIDLGGENLWHDCSRPNNSSSNRKVDCESNKCPKGAVCTGTGCIGPYKPGCAIHDCDITITNPLAQFTSSDPMAEDVIFLSHTYVPGFLAGCVALDDGISGHALRGLPKSTKGIIGFSRSKLALPTQLVLANKLPPMLSLCFPSSNNLKGFGNVFIGAGGHPQVDSKFLQTTPLVVNPVATGAVSIYGAPSIEYFIDVRSIKIDGHVVNLNPSLLSVDKKGNGGTKISALTPWTELHSSLYKPFVQEFVNKAAGRRMKRVASVPPFDACFDSSTIGNSVTGLAVPTVDLVLPGGVQWSVYGANSMVMTRKNVACLAFVDGGTKPRMFPVKLASIVIGGHQLEDNLLVIDMASSKLSFSSSLLLRNVTCSHA
ncbi:Basic 7S globulin [Spatholobus suberectus]|nr:Basic 7S globulin [Spatholobus suberectus]